MNPPLDSDLLRTFLAVATTGNVTRAAEKIGRTQSAVSIQIKRLEEVLGESVFERGSRGVTLTPQGQSLLVNANRIVGLLDETMASIRAKPLGGPVRIGLPEEYGYTVLPRALAAFASQHPQVQVTVKCDYSAKQMAALEADELDLAVIFNWEPPTMGEVLFVDPTVWVTSEVHCVHEITPVPIAVYQRSDWCQKFAIGSLDRHKINYRVAYSCDTGGGLKIAAVSGLAIAPLARSNIPPGCRELTETEGFPVIDSSNVVLRRNPRMTNPAIEGMAKVIRDAFQPMGTAAL
ncbi:LysR family transcriptional regulator [Phyllobacterium meliloti]|uniref:LysR family transcriptional regulator n=1 Tax=Phyllobacterium meliloti TaxID=555317 RepID=UPI001D145756|nr:LysR family transcriptional regulator [Phyllobacterium sp. T1293]UGX84689.1 LysR family transcriptional regulator [Phyllobacterium sp. T1293]